MPSPKTKQVPTKTTTKIKFLIGLDAEGNYDVIGSSAWKTKAETLREAINDYSFGSDFDGSLEQVYWVELEVPNPVSPNDETAIYLGVLPDAR